MHEDPDYKGPKEDCVEECMIHLPSPPRQILTDLLRLSLPSTTLRNRMRSTQTLQSPQIKCSTQQGHAAIVYFGHGPISNQEEQSQVIFNPSVQHSIASSQANIGPETCYHKVISVQICRSIVKSVMEDGVQQHILKQIDRQKGCIFMLFCPTTRPRMSRWMPFCVQIAFPCRILGIHVMQPKQQMTNLKPSAKSVALYISSKYIPYIPGSLNPYTLLLRHGQTPPLHRRINIPLINLQSPPHHPRPLQA